jgi:hypothetical protein
MQAIGRYTQKVLNIEQTLNEKNLATGTNSEANCNCISYANAHHMQHVDDCQLNGWSFV